MTQAALEIEDLKEPVVTESLGKEFGLNSEEYALVSEILGRLPTYTELGIFSVMWSEHCSYKSSRVHLKKLPVKNMPMTLMKIFVLTSQPTFK